ncbi:MAG: mandelate racemase/muconate lactonizing enzyme family protein [Puniceicoccaceae bacterium]
MKTNRRAFLKSTAILGLATGTTEASTGLRGHSHEPVTNYKTLDAILKQPVLRRGLFPNPVTIDSVELLRDRNNFICRVRSKDGAEGISIGHPFISKQSYPMFVNLLAPRFLNQDARDLDQLVELAAERLVKNQGVPLCVQLATLEFAILDMLGKIAHLPAGRLLGDVINSEVAIYLGHHYSNLRKLEPEESLELMRRDAEETSARAIKLRAGSGDQMGLDKDNAPGRTEKLIRMAREVFGDGMVLMIDGNGSYSVQEAIRIGRLLEEYNYAFYEEPVPWNWYEEQKLVERSLDIPMAGGEEEFSMHLFRFFAGNRVFQILQPDLFYFGGMIRTMKVARMAAAAGLRITPHISGGGLGFVYMLQMVSVCPAAYDYHEFKMFATKDANGTPIPVESTAGPFESIAGSIKVPSGFGLGVAIDPDYIQRHTAL